MNAENMPTYVLVIDDEKGLRDMLTYSLTRRGYRVRAAASGEQGIEAAREEEPDVVLCDIMMPGMDGIAVLEILKRERPTVQVILATGFPTGESAARAAELGSFAYLAKPYDLLAVFALLDEAAGMKRARAAVSAPAAGARGQSPGLAS